VKSISENPAKRPEVREKIRLAKLKNNPGAFKKGNKTKSQYKSGHNGFWLGKKFSKEHKNKKSIVMIGKRVGSKSPTWKGGITPINKKIRNSTEYKLWREAVFKRDNWTCVWCGATGNIQADHIKRFSDFPELRFAIDNGRTLCIPCHKKTDTYGFKK
jgi:ribosomal protein S27AE